MFRHTHYAKLHAVSFGLAWGVLAAILLFVFGLLAMNGYATAYVQLMASVYFGYGPSIFGAIIGATWGFVYSFIAGLIIALLYNCFVAKCKCKHWK